VKLHPSHPAFDRAELLIHTPDRDLENHIFSGADEVSPSDGVTYRNERMYKKRDPFTDPTLLIGVDIAADVGKGIAAAWLYDKLQDRDVIIETAGGSYETTKEAIKSSLEDIASSKNQQSESEEQSTNQQ